MKVPTEISAKRFSSLQKEALLTPLIAALILAVLSLWRISSLQSTARWVDHTDQVIAQANLTERLLIDAETGIRGFYVNGDVQFLGPYDNALKKLPDAFDILSHLIGDNLVQMNLINDLRRLSSDWEKIAARSLELRKESRPQFAPPNNEGKAVMDQIRGRFDEFIVNENVLRVQRTADQQTSSNISIVLGLTLTFALGLFVAFRSRRLMQILGLNYEGLVINLEKRALELYESREWFSTTLTSIGDAVIVVDTDGRVVFLNPIAEKLTGWTLDQAKTRSMAEVFKIVNEETREPAFNPVGRVLESGVIVGLANHTVLISKDTSEYPIEDSAAPVRAGNGKVQGVVLVFRDITERYKIEKEKKEQAEKIEKALRSRDEFVSIASHELKTPLSSLKLQLQLTERAIKPGMGVAITPEKLSHTIGICLGQTQRLASLVEDLLDVSRIQSGRMTYQFEKMDLTALAQESFDRFSSQFTQQKIPLEVICSGPVTVNGDRFRIDQVIANLLSNAIKYGGNSPVKIIVSEDSQFGSLVVKDEGPGIDPAKQSVIFDRFERAVDSTNISGLGLGLYISRQIAGAHKGFLDVQSALGAGAAFTLKIPKA